MVRPVLCRNHLRLTNLRYLNIISHSAPITCYQLTDCIRRRCTPMSWKGNRHWPISGHIKVSSRWTIIGCLRIIKCHHNAWNVSAIAVWKIHALHMQRHIASSAYIAQSVQTLFLVWVYASMDLTAYPTNCGLLLHILELFTLRNMWWRCVSIIMISI